MEANPVTGQGSTPNRDVHGDLAAPSAAQMAFNTSVAHPARVYDYWLGGKDNFAADRVAAEQVIEANPNILPGVRANRAFLSRAVEYLAGEAGIRQFLDLGTGLPTAENTHEVAQSIAPECRVVYVDNDPIVLVHAQALLTSTPEGLTSYVEADARDTAKILAGAANTLDLSKPVAVMALMILQYLPDSDAPHQAIARLMEGMPSGSYLTVSDTTCDIDVARVSSATSRLNEHMGPITLTLRSCEEITRFFDGLELVDPGVVPLPEWRCTATDTSGAVIPAYAGMGRKP
jgi:O-methyltransferase involved in polyketide biosynthesis